METHLTENTAFTEFEHVQSPFNPSRPLAESCFRTEVLEETHNVTCFMIRFFPLPGTESCLVAV